jgi:hypothetical protein
MSVIAIPLALRRAAAGAAPKGKRNGNYRHGDRTEKAVATRRDIGDLLRQSRLILKRL